jgi:ribonuclease HI
VILIAIDGATRRPGKDNCLAVGAMAVKNPDGYRLMGIAERNSTSQRGELIALEDAIIHGTLVAIAEAEDDLYLITDSEYVYNAITKEWYKSWDRKGWVTAAGEPVKNQDIWKNIVLLMATANDKGVDIHCYHTKGHLVSIGKVTARKSLEADPTGIHLRELIEAKYPEAEVKYADKFEKARALFIQNHGFAAPPAVHREIVILNTLVDLYAGFRADIEDKLWIK